MFSHNNSTALWMAVVYGPNYMNNCWLSYCNKFGNPPTFPLGPPHTLVHDASKTDDIPIGLNCT